MSKEFNPKNDAAGNNEVVKAMNKISIMMDAEKKQLVTSHEKSSEQRTPLKAQAQDTKNSSHYREPDTIENAKRAALEISELVKRAEDWNKQAILRNKENLQRDSRRIDPQKTVERLYELENKKKEKLAAMQYQKYKEELAMLKARPEISINSRMLSLNRPKQPVYMRTKAVLDRKKENIEKLKKEVEEVKRQKELEAIPPWVIRPRTLDERPRSPNQFLNHVFSWQTRRNEILQREQYEAIAQEMEKLTFKPYINPKSRQLAEKKYEGAPLEKRLIKMKNETEDRKRAIRDKSAPSFKPTLNQKTIALISNSKSREDSFYNQNRYRELDSSQFMNRSFVDLSTAQREFPGSESFVESRSKSPAGSRKKTPKSPLKVYDVEYSPALDFLLKKVSKK